MAGSTSGKVTFTTRKAVGSVVVIEKCNGELRPIGLITDRDIVVAVLGTAIELDQVTVADVMAGDLVCTSSDEDIWEAVERMSENGVRRLPVTDTAGGLIGILSMDDLVELLAESVNNIAGIIRRGERREHRRQVRA